MSIRSISSRAMLPLSLLPLLCGTASSALAQGPLSFAAALAYPAGTSPTSVAVGDFNADGQPDLAVADFSSNTVSILLGNAGGSCRCVRRAEGRPGRKDDRRVVLWRVHPA